MRRASLRSHNQGYRTLVNPIAPRLLRKIQTTDIGEQASLCEHLLEDIHSVGTHTKVYHTSRTSTLPHGTLPLQTRLCSIVL